MFLQTYLHFFIKYDYDVNIRPQRDIDCNLQVDNLSLPRLDCYSDFWGSYLQTRMFYCCLSS